MTASIGNEHSLRPARPPENAEPDTSQEPLRLIRGVQIFAIGSALAGVACLTSAFSQDEWRSALAGSTLVILSAVASSIWIAHVVMADRVAFYQRGKADGWYEGWRGQPPTTDYPLMRGH